jgi:O-acetyl-ADP-ribose deacetylase (regulator of RNase III)
VAFPAISCGVYGYPLGAAAAIAVEAVTAFGRTRASIETIALVAFDEEVFAAISAAINHT